VSRIRALAETPRPRGSQKLAGDQERYRIRQGAYRVVYSVDDEARVVEIVKIGHRRECIDEARCRGPRFRGSLDSGAERRLEELEAGQVEPVAAEQVIEKARSSLR